MSKVLRIKPVAKGYFKTSKVTIREIAQKRRAGTAIFAVRFNPDETMTSVFLIPEPAKRLTEGTLYNAEHMNTGRKYGQHLVQVVMEFKFKNGVLEIKNAPTAGARYSSLFDIEAVAFEMA